MRGSMFKGVCRWGLVLAAVLTARTALAQSDQGSDAASGPAVATIGTVEVSVDSAKVDYVALQGRNSADGGGQSEGKVLVMHIKLFNKGDSTVTYHSYNGDPAKKGSQASVGNSKGKRFTLVNFGKFEPVGCVHDADIGAGQTIGDVLAFNVPSDDDAKLALFLPGGNLGGSKKYVVFTLGQ